MKILQEGKTVKIYPQRYKGLPIMEFVGTATERLTLQERKRLELEYCLSELTKYEREQIIGNFKQCVERKSKDGNYYEVLFDRGPGMRVSYFSALIFGYRRLESVNYKQLSIC